jgi:uncharacterized repeat protein (TIGR01451 family)
MSRSTVTAVLLSICVSVSAYAGADLQVGMSAPQKAAIGNDVYMAMVVSNGGPDAGSSFTLTYTPPTGMTFVQINSKQLYGGSISCTTPAVGANAALTCSGSTSGLGAGPVVNFVYKVAASVAPGTSLVSTATISSANDPNSANNSSSATSIATGIPDLRPSSTFPPSYTPGIDFHYTMGVRNNGPGAATNVQLQTRVSAGISWLSPKSIAQTSGPTMNCTLDEWATCRGASLAAGEQATFDVVLSSPPSARGTAYATTDAALADFNYYTAAVNAYAARVEVTDLKATSTAPATATIGNDLTYHVNIQNLGPSDALTATATWTTPPGTTFLKIEGAYPSECTTPAVGAAGTVTCTLSSVDTFLGRALWFHARIMAPGTIVNSATLAAASDSNPSNNTTSATTTVADVPHGDLSISASSDPYAIAGHPFHVQLTFGNAGPSTMTSVTASVTFPPGAQLQLPSDCSGAAGGAACAAGDLAPGATVKKTMTVVFGNSVANAAFTANATSATIDLYPSNNSASTTVMVYPNLADLVVTAVPLPTAPVAPGDEVVLQPTVVNHGAGPEKATLSFDLPLGAKLLAGNGCSRTLGTVTVTCTTAELFLGSSAPFAIHIQAPLAAGQYDITFLASGSLPEAHPGDNTAAVRLTVAGDAQSATDLALTVQPSSEVWVAPSAPVAFAVVVENRGPNPADGISISGALPPSITLVAATSSKATCDAGADIRCSIASLGAGESAVVNVIVTARALGTATIDLTASSSTGDLDLTNNAGTLRINAVDHPRRHAVGR